MTDLFEKLQKKENELAFMIAGNPAELIKRPVFHYASPGDRITRPIAILRINDRIHLFYQWHTKLDGKEKICWGHSSSSDFINWNPEPLALVPDHKEDCEGCLSGSVLEHNGSYTIVYTGVTKEKDLEVQNQCIAKGDGIKFQKIEENPIVTSRNIPFIYEKTHFNSPHIWINDEKYFMCCSIKKTDKNGLLVIFSSSNLTDWTFFSFIDEKNHSDVPNWENPVIRRMNSTDFLFYSASCDGEKHTFYKKIHFDVQDSNVLSEAESGLISVAEPVDYGLDFHDPIFTELPDGRTVMTGILLAEHKKDNEPEELWSGQLSIPREITFRNGRLYQTPVRELSDVRINRVCGEILPKEETEIEILDGRHFELKTELTVSDTETGSMSLYICKKDKHYVEIRYDAKKGTLLFDRSRTKYPGKKAKKEIPVSPTLSGTICFLCIIDTSSVEIFINDGEKVFSNTFCASPELNEVSVRSDMSVPIMFNYYHLGTPVKPE